MGRKPPWKGLFWRTNGGQRMGAIKAKKCLYSGLCSAKQIKGGWNQLSTLGETRLGGWNQPNAETPAHAEWVPLIRQRPGGRGR